MLSKLEAGLLVWRLSHSIDPWVLQVVRTYSKDLFGGIILSRILLWDSRGTL